MIKAVEELLNWMFKHHLDTKEMELTVHLLDAHAKHNFIYSIQREVSLMELDPKASGPNGLKFFGVPIHVEVKK